MSILEGAFFGLMQGLAEFLPISSSGHLNLLHALFGVNMEHQLLFNILLHVATLAAVGIVFWKDWADMLLHPVKNRTLLLLFIASLPALAAKMLFDDELDYAEVHNTYLGLCFLLTGIMPCRRQNGKEGSWRKGSVGHGLFAGGGHAARRKPQRQYHLWRCKRQAGSFRSG